MWIIIPLFILLSRLRSSWNGSSCAYFKSVLASLGGWASLDESQERVAVNRHHISDLFLLLSVTNASYNSDWRALHWPTMTRHTAARSTRPLASPACTRQLYLLDFVINNGRPCCSTLFVSTRTDVIRVAWPLSTSSVMLTSIDATHATRWRDFTWPICEILPSFGWRLQYPRGWNNVYLDITVLGPI